MSSCGNNSKTKLKTKFNLQVTDTSGKCEIGETVGRKGMEENLIPVLSCEGACIKGEIARLAANKLGSKEGYHRSCHGEFLTVPGSNISKWTKNADKVVVIDGCFLKCHSRIMENMLEPGKLVVFDALSHHKKYADVFDIDAVCPEERNKLAESVTNWVYESLEGKRAEEKAETTTCCG